MRIEELQEAPEVEMVNVDNTMATITRQWKEGSVDEGTYHSQMAHLYSITKKANECRHHATVALTAASPFHKAETYVALARILAYEHNLQDAVEHYNHALELEPSHDVALEEGAWCYLKLKHFDMAEAYFKKAIEEVDYMADTWKGLGLSAAHQQKYNEAIVHFKKATELEHQPGTAHHCHYMIGLCYGHLKDFYRALSHYTKCLDANPSHAQALNNMAALYFEHDDDLKTAVTYLKKAEVIAGSKNDSETLQLVYINLSRMYSIIKEFALEEMYRAKLFKQLGFGDDGFDEEED